MDKEEKYAIFASLKILLVVFLIMSIGSFILMILEGHTIFQIIIGIIGIIITIWITEKMIMKCKLDLDNLEKKERKQNKLLPHESDNKKLIKKIKEELS